LFTPFSETKDVLATYVMAILYGKVGTGSLSYHTRVNLTKAKYVTGQE
jgi:hypothetical protein